MTVEENEPRPRRRWDYTVNELRAALDQLVEAQPGAGARPILFEGRGEGFEHWDGTMYHSEAGDYYVLEPQIDVWWRPGDPEEQPRCGACGLPHDLAPESWPAEICRRVSENGSAVR